MAGQGQGNPAVVGLAGFGLTTLLLQFHNLGWCGTGVVFCTAIILGGGAQLVAGFQEFRCGNNFGYSVFYRIRCLSGFPSGLSGCFWTCRAHRIPSSEII